MAHIRTYRPGSPIRLLTYGQVIRYMRGGLDTCDIARLLDCDEADVFNVLAKGDEG